MKRELRFRAWDTGNQAMVEPYYFEPMPDCYSNEEPFRYYADFQDLEDGSPKPCFIMQFTGLKDKNGVEIFEGDIVSMFSDDIMIIVNVYGCFYHKHPTDEAYGSMHNIHYPFEPLKNDPYYEVIGNIYEHPHLLTSKTEKQ